jgi:hypothetical protein
VSEREESRIVNLPLLLVVLTCVAVVGGLIVFFPRCVYPPPPPEIDISRLQAEAKELCAAAAQYYQKAMSAQSAARKEELFKKSYDASMAGMERLEKIKEYYDERGIRPKEGEKFEWEVLLNESRALASDLSRPRDY